MPTADSLSKFDAIVASQIERFPSAKLVRRVQDGNITLAHYHALLTTIFHQTYSGPYTFARAGVNCAWHHEAAKEYLIRHAEEERTHWRWVLDDLRATGYAGPSPRDLPPHPACMAYIGLNEFVADRFPVARLAIASVLEGIGATHGGTYGRQLLGALKLTKDQASFFLSHAETDKTHTVELREVIAQCHLDAEEWQWMNYAAETAGMFYRGMYDHEGYA
ncbi:iron-containing redox enzyme family protein [Rudaea sp.]|uniref:iron-containing redox enzyme family protein n=1 Tax=Rudaea sp. TaxID=2136325 RepID=UPI00321F9F17